MEAVIGLLIFVIFIIGCISIFKKLLNKKNAGDVNKLKLEKERIIEENAALTKENESIVSENNALKNEFLTLKDEYEKIDRETKALQELKAKADELTAAVQNKSNELQQAQDFINSFTDKKQEAENTINALQSKIDLYSRLDDFIGYGFYDTPKYLYETSERFAIEIKKVREEQKNFIKGNTVIELTGGSSELSLSDSSVIEKIRQAQTKLIVKTFNIECDLLIEKVNPANFERTLNRITSLASELEKLSPDLRFGFNSKYIQLKLEECKLLFQYKLKKKEEQEEQRLIKEQMREEEKARREYEAQLAQAEKEEKLYQDLLEKAQKELEKVTAEEKEQTLQKIQALEKELAEAKEKSERAKSMAEQTKRGHVYIISNIGSFGKDIYKIGMTRRLDPMDRVKELGDASVPFSFDVHAIIYTEDAPKLENELHKKFHQNRVNAINLKKEFFHVSLEDIRNEVEKLTGKTAEFTMTILAEEYYQTQRLHHQ